jgi:drug/metabolite transporter (DMT)-like permease
MVRKFALLVAISMAWAAGYLFIDDADSAVRPITATAAMAIVAAAFMLPVVTLLLKRPLLAPLRHRGWVPLVMGLSAIALPNLAVVDAERTVLPDLAALLGATVPILTLLFGTFVTRQVAFSSWRMLGALIALIGLAVFVGWQEFAADDLEVKGMLVMMTGGLVFALNGIFVSYEADGLDEYVLATWTVTFGAIFLTAAAFLFEDPLATARGWREIWPLVAEGVIGIGFAYLAYYALVARSGAYFASLYAFLVPPLGVIGAALAFGEVVTVNHVAGLAIVLVGLGFMTHRDAAPVAAARLDQSPA